MSSVYTGARIGNEHFSFCVKVGGKYASKARMTIAVFLFRLAGRISGISFYFLAKDMEAIKKILYIK